MLNFRRKVGNDFTDLQTSDKTFVTYTNDVRELQMTLGHLFDSLARGKTINKSLANIFF